MSHRLGRPIKRNVGYFRKARHRFYEICRHFDRVRFQVVETFPDTDTVALQECTQPVTHRVIELKDDFNRV